MQQKQSLYLPYNTVDIIFLKSYFRVNINYYESYKNFIINGKYEGKINGRVQSGNITNDEVRIPDWALILGANYFISNFQIDLRYSLPLTSWPSDSATELKISMFQLLVGVSF